MSADLSHLVQILLPKETGDGQPIGKDWFDGFLKELTEKFGGATSFLRAPGQGLWQSGGSDGERQHRRGRSHGRRNSTAATGTPCANRLERELSQDEIVIRAQEISRL